MFKRTRNKEVGLLDTEANKEVTEIPTGQRPGQVWRAGSQHPSGERGVPAACPKNEELNTTNITNRNQKPQNTGVHARTHAHHEFLKLHTPRRKGKGLQVQSCTSNQLASEQGLQLCPSYLNRFITFLRGTETLTCPQIWVPFIPAWRLGGTCEQ